MIGPSALVVAGSLSERAILLEAIQQTIDHRLRRRFLAELAEPDTVGSPLRGAGKIALVGHRGAGKSRLLPLLARWTGLAGFDLDRVIERRTGRTAADWVTGDADGFRVWERRCFETLAAPALVATGGGFLSHHPDLLASVPAVLVPVTFATYRERLLADRTRPRLRPELPLEEEIATVYAERERAHARIPLVPLASLVGAFEGPS